MRRILLVFWWRLRQRRWVRWNFLICQHRRHCCQCPDPVNTTAPLRLDNFTQTRCTFCFLNWCLRCHCQDLRMSINTLAPPRLETFTQTRCIFCFLYWSLCCRLRYLGLIFLCRRLRCGRQFLRPVIATQQPPLLSLNLQSLGHIVLSITCLLPTPPSSLSIPWSRKWNTTYLWAVDSVFLLVTVCTCYCWARFST